MLNSYCRTFLGDREGRLSKNLTLVENGGREDGAFKVAEIEGGERVRQELGGRAAGGEEEAEEEEDGGTG